MALLETAGKYLLDIFTANDDVKKFGKEFIAATVNWIKPWFLTTDIPRNIDKLEDATKAIDKKKEIIEENLDALKNNAAFMQELEAKVKEYESHQARIKNVIVGAKVDTDGNIHIGDKGASSGNDFVEKNVVRGGTFTSGGDFHLGDNTVQAHTVIQHHYHGGVSKPGTDAPRPVAPIKAELKALIASGKTAKAIERLLDLSESTDSGTHNMALQLSGRLSQLNRKENLGIIGHSDAKIELNQISNAVIAVIDGLAD